MTLYLMIAAIVVVGQLLAGCATHKDAAPATMSQPVYPSGTTSRVDSIIRNAKLEVANLRADLGSARIAVTKREIEAQELKRDLAEYRQRLSELQSTKDLQQYTSEKQQQELAAVKAERERLTRDKQDLQRDLAEIPKLREALAASRASEDQVQAKVKELETALAALAEQLTKTRDPRSNDYDRGPVQPIETAPPGATSSLPGESAAPLLSVADETHKASAMFVTALPASDSEWLAVTVKPGDTLWDLARAHGITIERLKAINKISGDVIRAGRVLMVPAKP